MLTLDFRHTALLARLDDAGLRQIAELPDLFVSPRLYAALVGKSKPAIENAIRQHRLPAIRTGSRHFYIPAPPADVNLWRDAIKGAH